MSACTPSRSRPPTVALQWDAQALNQRRLDLLQRDSSTRYTKNGVIAIDNTLIDHDGKLIADVGWFWDHADQRHLIAHDYLIANYVCASGKHWDRRATACTLPPGSSPRQP
jgi:hypothetical protein